MIFVLMSEKRNIQNVWIEPDHYLLISTIKKKNSFMTGVQLRKGSRVNTSAFLSHPPHLLHYYKELLFLFPQASLSFFVYSKLSLLKQMKYNINKKQRIYKRATSKAKQMHVNTVTTFFLWNWNRLLCYG